MMQNHKKLSAKILSLALSAAMLLGTMSMTTFAADGGVVPGSTTISTIVITAGDPTYPATAEGLNQAFTDIADNGTITLNSDINLGSTSAALEGTKNVTLDLNGKTITYSGGSTAISTKENIVLTIANTGGASSGKIEATAACNAIQIWENSSVILNAGTLTSTSADGNAIKFNTTGTLTVKSATVSAPNGGCAIVHEKGGKIVLESGAVVSSNTGNTLQGAIAFLTAPAATASDKVVIDVQAGASVTNANPAGYALNFNIMSFPKATITDYYAIADGATVGRIFPSNTPPPTPTPTPGGGGSSSGGSSSGDGSSGGSFSASRVGGSAGGVATPGKTAIDATIGTQGSKNALAQAVKNAVATGAKSSNVYTNYANYSTLTKDGVKAINNAAAAATAGKNVSLNTMVQLDKKVGNAVVSRVTVDPVKLATVMPDKLGLGVWFNQKQDKQVTSVTSRLEKEFDNKIVAITFEQKSPLAVNMEFSAKLDLSALNTKSLYFYSYDPVNNQYNLITAPNYRVDNSGYSHITAPLGGSIIITDKPLTKK